MTVLCVYTLLEPALNSHPSPKRPELHQAEHNWESVKEGSSAVTVEKSTQVTRDRVPSRDDVKTSLEMASVADCAATRPFASPPSLSPPIVPPASPSELKNAKRVRKLKKRKTLKKSQGTEPPESSDTELDGEALRPRWLRSRRRASGGSQVSTSTQPSEDRDADAGMDVGEQAAGQLPQKADFRPPHPVMDLTLSLDSEDSMEVTAACQRPHMDPPGPTPPAQVPDTSRSQSLACNEVTSTSDMDICKSSER